MAAFVFPGSTPPIEAPESVVEEAPNPLLDATTHGSLRRRRADGLAAENLFGQGSSPSVEILDRGAPRNYDSSCWLIFENRTNLSDAMVQEELGKFQEVRAIRRGSNTMTWLIQFKSLVYACKAMAQVPGCLRLAASESEVESLSVVNTLESTKAVRTSHWMVASSPSAPNVWKHSRNVFRSEELEASLPCWKTLLLWLIGVEEHPARFITRDAR